MATTPDTLQPLPCNISGFDACAEQKDVVVRQRVVRAVLLEFADHGPGKILEREAMVLIQDSPQTAGSEQIAVVAGGLESAVRYED